MTMENTKETKTFKSISLEFIITFCDIILFSSAINCLFQSLAHSKTFDIILLIISLILGLVVYRFSMNVKRTPKFMLRFIIAICSVFIWAISIPVLYQFFH